MEYQYIVDVIKIFIRTKRLADYNGHIFCIGIRMLEIFSAAGHYQYAKGARLYFQLMKRLEAPPRCKKTFKSFRIHGNHVVHYCCHEWSGIWYDICIELRLMKEAKSQCELCRERMGNSDSGHKCWIQTLNHFSSINDYMEESTNRQRLCLTWIKRDTEAVGLILK